MSVPDREADENVVFTGEMPSKSCQNNIDELSDFDQIDHFIGIFAEQDTPQDPIGARIDDGF